MSTSAAPPSEIELEFAAVTEPSLAKAGRSVGILSKSAVSGCSSWATTVSPLRCLTVTGVTSPSKEPSSIAVFARVSEVMANSSCCSRVNW